MRQISPQDVNTARTLVLWATRLGSVGAFTVGLYFVLKRLAFFGITRSTGVLVSYTGVGEEQSLSRGIGLLLVALVLALTGRRLARWAIPLANTGCPACGYAMSGSDGGRCPECGLEHAPSPPEPD